MAASTVLHLAVVGLMLAWRYIGPLQRLNYRLENYDVEIVRYNLPEPLLFASAGRQGGGGGSQGGAGGGSAGKQGAAGSRRPGSLTISLPSKAPALPAAPATPAALQAQLAAPAPPAPAAPKPRFEVPQKQVTRQRDVIVQPDYSPQVRIAGKAELPNLFLWTQRDMQAPVRQLKTFVPGERKRVPRDPTALPDATPSLDLPNQEVKVADLKIGWRPELPKKPELPVFVANTTPVRIERRALDLPSELPATPLPAGQPVNLLALMERPAPPSAIYSVEGGNRFPTSEPSGAAGSGEAKSGVGTEAKGNAGAAGSGANSHPGGVAGGTGTGPGGAGAGVAGGAGTGAAGGAGTGAAGAAGTGSGAAGAGGGGRSGSGAGSGTAGAGTGAGGTGAGIGKGSGPGAGGRGSGTGSGSGSGPGAGSGTGSGAGAGSGAGGAGRGSGSGTGGRGSGSGSRDGGLGSGVDVAGLRLSGPSTIRTESPNTGAFDVVVVHQSPREVMPETPGLLTGQPIYTVYMAVPGSRREWILQYAIPGSREPIQQRTENSVQLGAATPVRAPYPLRKPLLDLTAMGPLEGRVVVYGAITNKGQVENMRVIRGVRSEVDTAVVACLRQFLFRPAVRDGVPVLVEALFGVPLN